MNNSRISRNESRPLLSTLTRQLNDSLSKQVDVPVGLRTRKDELTPPLSGPPASIWPEPVPTCHRTQGVIPRIESKANDGLPSSPLSIASNLTQDTVTMNKGDKNASYRSSMIAWHSSQALAESVPPVKQQFPYKPPPSSTSLLPLTSWGDFPPKQAPEFETTDLTTATAYGKPSDPLPQYLEDLHELQSSMYRKLKSIIHLRKGIELPFDGTYEIPSGDSWLKDLINELKAARVLNEMPEEEPKLVREMLDEWCDFVDIKCYEDRESSRRYQSKLSELSRPSPNRAPSKSEQLLGYDESMFRTPNVSNTPIHTRPFFSRLPSNEHEKRNTMWRRKHQSKLCVASESFYGAQQRVRRWPSSFWHP
ncbi:hypothetical protein F4810DRAFT_447877 [Camillea tinctor]|nr:hypothetical protein F4810DRAFT_447877 [Camillea tinctor]